MIVTFYINSDTNDKGTIAFFYYLCNVELIL